MCNYLLYSGVVASQITQIISQYLVPDFKKTFFYSSELAFCACLDTAILTYGNCIGKGMVLWYPTKPCQKSGIPLWIPTLVQCTLGLWFFFGLKNPIGGLVVIVALFFLIIKTVQQFKTIELFASRLLYPYLIWICFASLLNGGIVFLNYL